MAEFQSLRAEIEHLLNLVRELEAEDVDRVRHAILRARKEGIPLRDATPPKTSGRALHLGQQILVYLNEADSKFDAEQVRELDALVEALPNI
jgi:hypothetical protein